MRPSAITCAALLLVASAPAHAGWTESFSDWFRQNLIDEQDGKVDMSNYLSSAQGFFPLPIIITEPAVGFGIGAAVAYFHPPKEVDESAEVRKAPPSISVGFAAGTDNGSRLAGAAHSGVWRDDHVRYLGAIAATDVNLKFYPDLDGSGTSEAIRFNIDGAFLYQQLQFRWQETDWWIGGNFLFVDAKTAVDLEEGTDPGQLEPLADFTQGGLGVYVEYDGRDTVFTPTSGLKGIVEFRNYDQLWGSDFDYNHAMFSLQHFSPIGDHSSLGIRLEAETVSGDVPFFGYPYVNLRGIPALRYQGEDVATLEVEYLWGITPRWSVALFAGLGTTASVDVFGTEAEDVSAGGAGFRYRIARKLGMQIGVDVARGPEETAWYLTVGSAWQ